MPTLPDQEPSPAYLWLRYLSRMDDALAHLLAFPSSNRPPSIEYGLDLPLDAEQAESFRIADDLFNELSLDGAISSRSIDDAAHPLSYDHTWLLAKCNAISTRQRSGITAIDLGERLLSFLGSIHDGFSSLAPFPLYWADFSLL